MRVWEKNGDKRIYLKADRELGSVWVRPLKDGSVQTEHKMGYNKSRGFDEDRLLDSVDKQYGGKPVYDAIRMFSWSELVAIDENDLAAECERRLKKGGENNE